MAKAKNLDHSKRDQIVAKSRWTVMPATFMDCELYVGTPESYVFADGSCALHPPWWMVDKVSLQYFKQIYMYGSNQLVFI